MNTSNTPEKDLGGLHFEHQLWANEAEFYKDELKVYQNRLEEVASKNTKAEINVQIEHFQNQLTIERQKLHDLNHEIKNHERELANIASQYASASDHKIFPNHNELHEKMNTFKKIYYDLKKEITDFFAASL